MTPTPRPLTRREERLAYSQTNFMDDTYIMDEYDVLAAAAGGSTFSTWSRYGTMTEEHTTPQH